MDGQCLDKGLGIGSVDTLIIDFDSSTDRYVGRITSFLYLKQFPQFLVIKLIYFYTQVVLLAKPTSGLDHTPIEKVLQLRNS
jgi:hypothetical protein